VVGLQEAAVAMHSVCNTGAEQLLKGPHTLFVLGKGAAIVFSKSDEKARVVAQIFSARSAGLRERPITIYSC
jgi:hypothetical protein